SYVVEEEIPLTLARRLLSAKIVELLEFLRDREGLCVSEIARTLNRSPSNVYNDLKLLADYNVIALERRGRRTIPRLLVEELRIAV
ncbi:MAG TPA: ArsR family transcriptional regulator, partial [Thermofilaceae archaeon]|nr:ArsR family transcriptional regulator [Thermofilaceae archaeon]